MGVLNLAWNIRSKYVFPKGKLDVVVCKDQNAPDLVAFELINIGPVDAIVAGLVLPTKKNRRMAKDYYRVTTRKHSTYGGTPLSEDAAFPRRILPGEVVRIELKKNRLRPLVDEAVGMGAIDTSGRYFLLRREPYRSFIKLLRATK